MFGLGMGELILIAVVALLAVGPDRLPQAARSVGQGIRDLRRQTDDLQQSLESDGELGEAFQELRTAWNGTRRLPRNRRELGRTLDQMTAPPSRDTKGTGRGDEGRRGAAEMPSEAQSNRGSDSPAEDEGAAPAAAPPRAADAGERSAAEGTTGASEGERGAADERAADDERGAADERADDERGGGCPPRLVPAAGTVPRGQAAAPAGEGEEAAGEGQDPPTSPPPPESAHG